MLAARMRLGDAWSDANILNISSRGLLLHAAMPPSRGTYIEVRRGDQVIVGRVIWTKADRFGVLAQDRLAIDSLIANVSTNWPPANDTAVAAVERRSLPRSERLEWRYAENRDRGRSLQFACVAGLGFILVACAYDTVRETLSQPLSIVSTQLAQSN